MIHILAIDDEPLILETIELAFPDDKVVSCENAQDGINEFLEVNT